MQRKYSGRGEAAVGTNKTVLNLISAATVRPAIYEIICGSDATPADLATHFVLGRFTAVGTEGSGFTPIAIDPGDPASLADYGVAHSAEPTYTANAIVGGFPLNQRATFRWIAAPGCELKCPASANNGIGLYSENSGGTAIHNAVMYHGE